MKNRIYDAYRGEIYGISFFSYFAKNYAEKSHLQLWETLIQIETLTADLLEASLDRLLVKYDRYDSDMQQKGEEDAAAWLDLPWPALVQTLIDWVKPYETKYRLWAEESTEERDTFLVIAAHETAIYQCWQTEIHGQSGIPSLLKFIKQYSAR